MSRSKTAAAVGLALCVSVAGACASGGGVRRLSGSPTQVPPGHPGSTDSGLVTDSGPYWCDLIPRDALRRVLGPAVDLHEFRNAGATKNNTICGVRDTAKYGPLGVQWNIDGGPDEVAAWTHDVASDRPAALPARLGIGFTVHSVSASRLPYMSVSAFRCGPHDPWIEIFLRTVAPGHDASRDLTALMEVAQRRFGEVHRCVPRPLGGS